MERKPPGKDNNQMQAPFGWCCLVTESGCLILLKEIDLNLGDYNTELFSCPSLKGEANGKVRFFFKNYGNRIVVANLECTCGQSTSCVLTELLSSTRDQNECD